MRVRGSKVFSSSDDRRLYAAGRSLQEAEVVFFVPRPLGTESLPNWLEKALD